AAALGAPRRHLLRSARPPELPALWPRAARPGARRRRALRLRARGAVGPELLDPLPPRHAALEERPGVEAARGPRARAREAARPRRSEQRPRHAPGSGRRPPGSDRALPRGAP